MEGSEAGALADQQLYIATCMSETETQHSLGFFLTSLLGTTGRMSAVDHQTIYAASWPDNTGQGDVLVVRTPSNQGSYAASVLKVSRRSRSLITCGAKPIEQGS